MPTKKRRLCSHVGLLDDAQRHGPLVRSAAEAMLVAVRDGREHDPAGVQCVTCGLKTSGFEEHKHAHPGKKDLSGHELVIDQAAAELYCTACGDYVYLPEVDRMATALLAVTHGIGSPLNNQNPGSSSPGEQLAIISDSEDEKHDEPMKELEPEANQVAVEATEQLTAQQLLDGNKFTRAELQLLTAQQQLNDMFETLPNDQQHYPAGLRGLNNMGHTCFMNSVLQALLQAPLLKSHYLLHRHSRQSCDITATGGYCVGCELDDVFSAAYSGERTPHSPAAFLHSWWMLAGSLLGRYQQQDAHEFFLFVLEMLSAAGPGGPSENISSKAFRGTMRSDVVCGCCGHTSTTIDPFTNISLEVPSSVMPPYILPRGTTNGGKSSGKPPTGANNGNAKQTKSSGANNKKGTPIKSGGVRLVGAALNAHLAKRKREVAFDVSASEAPADDSVSQEPGVSNSVQIDARTSPPLNPYAGSARLAAEPELLETLGQTSQMEMDSIIGDSSGENAASDEAARDTLSSPQILPLTQASGGTVSQLPGGALAGLMSPGSVVMQHPELAGYYKWPGPSVVGCLRRFVRQETLGSNERWQCEKCHASDNAAKQLSLLDLPPVLVLHAKRFEHSGGARATAKKLETFLSFPLDGLDVSAFISSSVLRERHMLHPVPPLTNTNQMVTASSGAAAFEDNTPAPETRGARMTRTRSMQSTGSRDEKAAGGSNKRNSGPVSTEAPSAPATRYTPKSGSTNHLTSNDDHSDMLYDLFAVICHKGTFQGGHYVSYVRCSNDQWYLCDDAWISPVDKEVVRNCQAYMLFYGQQKVLAGK